MLLAFNTLALTLGLAAGPAAQPLPLPADLVWICDYSDAGNRCTDVVFVSPVVVDCGNPIPLEAYEGGTGTMILMEPDGGSRTLSYASRSYNVRGGPGNLDAIKLFPAEPEAFGFVGDMEPCRTFARP